MQLEFETKPFLRRQMILNHVRELDMLCNQYLLKQLDWTNVQRELTDLYILIGADIDVSLIAERYKRFREKQEAEE